MWQWLPDYAPEQCLLLAKPFRPDVWRQQAVPAQDAVNQLQHILQQYVPCYQLAPERVAYDDIWLRDTLPCWRFQQLGSSLQWQGWQPQFDGWGSVQSTVANDQQLAAKLWPPQRLVTANWLGEGGMVTHNGRYALVGFNSIKQRNADYLQRFGEAQLKAEVKRSLAPLEVIFVQAQLCADETLGHIDNMALFINDSTLVYAATNDSSHPDFKACQQIAQALKQLPDTIRCIALPLPHPQYASADERQGVALIEGALERTQDLPLLCSYVNLIALPDTLIVPQYGIEEDHRVVDLLRRQLPNYGIQGIQPVPAREWVLGGGGLHCISHHCPQAMRPLVIADDPNL